MCQEFLILESGSIERESEICCSYTFLKRFLCADKSSYLGAA